MILQKDHLAEVACQVHPWERCLLVGCPGELDATLNCTFPFIRQQYLNGVLPGYLSDYSFWIGSLYRFVFISYTVLERNQRQV
jgi:hypothetical protein